MTQMDLSFDKQSETLKAINAIRVMLKGRWMAPHEIYAALRAQGIKVSAAAASSRVRDLRKPQFGGHQVPKRHRDGYYEYSLEAA